MAELTKYVEYPRSDFPVSVDIWDNMEDLNANTIQTAKQYSTLISNNNFTRAAALLTENPDINKVVFNAEKYNKLSDGIKATQKFFKEKVNTYMDEIAEETVILFSKTIGIDDSATGTAKRTNTYSAEKIDELHKTTAYTLGKSNWTASGYYFAQNLAINELTSDDSPIISVGNTAFDAKKKAQKYMSMCNAETYDGGITFTCKKLPDVDIVVLVKGR